MFRVSNGFDSFQKGTPDRSIGSRLVNDVTFNHRYRLSQGSQHLFDRVHKLPEGIVVAEKYSELVSRILERSIAGDLCIPNSRF